MNFNGFSTNDDRVDDGLPDRSTDESNDAWIEGKFHGSWTFRKFDPAIVLGNCTMILDDCWTDRTDEGHTMEGRTSSWNCEEFDRHMSHAADIQMDLL